MENSYKLLDLACNSDDIEHHITLLKNISDSIKNSPRIKYYDQIEVGFLKVYRDPLTLLGRLMTIWKNKKYTHENIKKLGTLIGNHVYIPDIDICVELLPPSMITNHPELLGWSRVILDKEGGIFYTKENKNYHSFSMKDGRDEYTIDMYNGGLTYIGLTPKFYNNIHENIILSFENLYGNLGDELLCKEFSKNFMRLYNNIPTGNIHRKHQEMKWYSLMIPFLYIWETSLESRDVLQWPKNTTYSHSQQEGHSGTIRGILNYRKEHSKGYYSGLRCYDDGIKQYVYRGMYTPPGENTRLTLKIEFAKSDEYHQQFITN